MDEECRTVPTQWIDIDNGEYHRRPGGPPVAPHGKSRLVLRGDSEDPLGIRADSPTCEFEGAWLNFPRLQERTRN
eukprot:1155084-Pyramimonas_sp.AAC.1